ncbi:RagB/SusD family nutrient uptake outer membrane protein [Rubrivirga sp. S365]|uniref:RagB/SusD family nutrient uptake outer membrane protein n=1 Tax=Rubrivirga litoralis TaxID=3075598 RepID=A0ABU3BRE8_9BACT|nr:MULTISPECIES: RagB/SusD family nutrient uptake outer membrane protein [unclassified Rubrivirga]MDT0631858.1 RagB/SusD family nutrient uptake outer membrane protein [Rubrivirga sp. F394]MDT7857911.1 RagB/SusD family nutrient uptake outer membrane protein [Rubrivirga sp. S365]
MISPRTAAAALALAVLASGCDLVEVNDRPNPNGPALEDILNNPTEAAIANVAVGVESSARTGLGTYLADVGVIGREYYRISPSDPRLTQDLLGGGSSVLDNNTFYLLTPWISRYRTIRNANTMLVALDANETLPDAETSAARGFAQTWIAYQYLLNLNLTFENGIRFIEPGEDAAGEVVGYDEALDRIAALFDEGAQNLASGSEEFFFETTIGQDVPQTVAGYRQINRALAARVDAYREDWQGVLDALDGSFIDSEAPLTIGAYHVFSTGAGDVQNPFFFALGGGGEGVLAQPGFVDDIEDGDTRISKVEERETARTFDGLTSKFDTDVYETSVSPIPIVRNAELVLLRAEANAQLGDRAAAVQDVNVIRNNASLSDYAGDSLIDEILRQRRYELYAEGHRWIDLRRYDRLGTLPIDREGDDVFRQFPIPETENV